MHYRVIYVSLLFEITSDTVKHERQFTYGKLCSAFLSEECNEAVYVVIYI